MPTDKEKRQLKRRYARLRSGISAILFDEDPARINLGGNTDEYDPEASTIMTRLGDCESAEAVASLVHEEFTRWFGSAIAGSVERYESAGLRIWEFSRE